MAWFATVGKEPPTQILDFLQHRWPLLDLRTPGEPGVVVFDEVTERLLPAIASASRQGRERVIALHWGNEPLPSREPWTLLAAGAADVLHWTDASTTGADLEARLSRWQEVDDILRAPVVRHNLVGSSACWLGLLRRLVEAARWSTASLLVMGETGTGKELLARLVHTLDQREQKGSLIVLDCTTIVDQLAGSEFFGHERGAYTGATYQRDGAFALADGGTLFLDEVGELPLGLQAQLLRVIQEGRYKRVGGNQWRDTNFRLVCATNRDLALEQCQGRFRTDLFHRLASVHCHVPPLRDRREDIAAITRHFLHAAAGREMELDPTVQEYLNCRDYPGNVRQLRQLVTQIVARHAGSGPVSAGDIPPEERPAPEAESWPDDRMRRSIREAMARGTSLKQIGRAAEAVAEEIALEEESGNVLRAARRLGITDRALQMRRAARREQWNTEPPDADAG